MRLGDLDALKIEIEKQIAYCDDKAKHQSDMEEVSRYSNTSYGLRLAHNYIDNAPTVKFSLMPADETKEDAYKRGYEKGKIKGILMAYERPQGKWIPTSEFLPEEYDSYLVMWRFRSGEYDGKLFYEICEYDPDEDEWERIEQSGEAGAEIVAWMPLPERYEPKQDDDTAKDMI